MLSSIHNTCLPVDSISSWISRPSAPLETTPVGCTVSKSLLNQRARALQTADRYPLTCFGRLVIRHPKSNPKRRRSYKPASTEQSVQFSFPLRPSTAGQADRRNLVTDPLDQPEHHRPLVFCRWLSGSSSCDKDRQDSCQNRWDAFTYVQVSDVCHHGD